MLVFKSSIVLNTKFGVVALMRRAQQALEFLSSYGFVFLIVIVVASSIFYFGVIPVSTFASDSCDFPPGFSCQEAAVTTGPDQVQFRLINQHGVELDLLSFEVSDDFGNQAGACAFPSDLDLAHEFLIQCPLGAIPAEVSTYDVTARFTFREDGEAFVFDSVGRAHIKQ